jgi:hypothetical protein
MELFHIHTLGTHDYSYVPNNIITVDEAFNNGIYQKMYNLNMSFTPKSLPKMFEAINKDLEGMGVSKRVEKSRIDELMHYIEFFGCDEQELKMFLNMSSRIIKDYYVAMNEMAYETCRQNSCPDAPSRLHSLYACNEEGLRFWLGQIHDGESDIYRIDVEQEPFVTNEELLPAESLSYGNKIQASYKYFNPKKKDLNGVTDEYLVQGRVKLLEKIGEVRAR